MKRLISFMLLLALLVSLIPAGAVEAATTKDEKKETIKLTGQVRLLYERCNVGDTYFAAFSSYTELSKMFGKTYVKSVKPTIKKDEITGTYIITAYEDTTIGFSVSLSTNKYPIHVYSSKNNNLGGTDRQVTVGMSTGGTQGISAIGKNYVTLDIKPLSDGETKRTVLLYLRFRDMNYHTEAGEKNPNYKKWMSDSTKVKVIIKKKPQEKADAELNKVYKSLKLSKYKTELEKAKAIANWIHTNVKYSHENYYNDWKHAVVDRESMCFGQASLYSMLARLAGLTYTTIGSAEKNHEWVLVKCDGLWYYADPTNLDGVYPFTKEDENGNIVMRKTANLNLGGYSYEYFVKNLEPEGEVAAYLPYEESKPWNPFDE